MGWQHGTPSVVADQEQKPKETPIASALLREENKTGHEERSGVPICEARMDGVNLFLGLLWLLGAMLMFAHEWLGGMVFRIPVGNRSITAAWVMLFLAVYNFMRWGSNRWRWVGLFVGVVCLLCSVILLAYDKFMGGAMLRVRLGHIPISLGWLVMVLAVYNLLRWGGSRRSTAKQRALEMAWSSREWETRRHPTEPLKPCDPNFNFTDEPSPPPNRGITDQPPSSN